MIKGVDISHWNYATVKNWNFSQYTKDKFIIMKASEGTGYKDNYVDFYTARIMKDNQDPLFGYYHFAQAKSIDSAPNEAENFLRSIGKHIYDHPMLALDVEADALKKSYIDIWSLHWLSYVEAKTGVKPLIYLQQSALKKFPQVAAHNYGLWVARWSLLKPKTDPWKIYAIWQTGSLGKIDQDKFNGDLTAWHKYTGRM